MHILEQFRTIPVDSATLLSVLGSYKSPNDKVMALVRSGALIRLKRGLFVVSPTIHRQTLSKELIANHMYGPSYVSFQSALSWYGLIPERVYAVRSVTVKRSRSFETPIGLYEYTGMPVNYYSIGIRNIVDAKNFAWMIASPEKALCDIILTSHGFRIQSVKAMADFLINDLRLDFSVIDKYDSAIIEDCIAAGRKRTELSHLLKFLIS